MAARPYVLDARTATGHFPGIGRYTANLARALEPLLIGDERLLLLRDPTAPSPWDLGRAPALDLPLSPFSLRQQWAVPRALRQSYQGRLLRRLDAAVYHSPYYLMPYWPGCPTLLTVHDLIPLLLPRHSTARARLLFRWTMGLALRAARRVIAVSAATRDDLLAQFRLPAGRVTVVPEAADPAFYPRPPAEIATIRRQHALPERYVLYLGSNKPHKNLARLVEAWATHHVLRFTSASRTTHHETEKLLIAGQWDPRFPEARRRVEELGLADEALFLGPLADEDLPALYSGATVFVFPSLYEGFGLPVLEALACGVPVACADGSALPEIVGDAALRFDPTDTAAIAAALRRLLTDAELRADLRERGLRRASQFSWERAAQRTLELYREAR
jgi:alpha-1,3-rhamnosyl/mannosyltransferase